MGELLLHDIASNSGIRVGSVETITYENLLSKKVNAWWVLKMLTFDHKVQHVAVSAEHVNQFELEGNTFLE
jgi:hypothetical protein